MADVRQADGREVNLEANEAERAALARRFGLVRIDRLVAEAQLSRDSDTVAVEGRLGADVVQSCAVSGEDLAVTVEEPLRFRFVPQRDLPIDEEVELDAEDCDEIEFTGTSFDLGEAVAQSLALAIDPFATGPAADEVRRSAVLGEPGESGPFARLAQFKENLAGKKPE